MDFFIDEKGYMRFSDSGILVHRWMAEKKLRRRLREGEVVHHIDRNKLNNYPENLYICKNQAHHFRLHLIDAKKFGWQVTWNGFNKGFDYAILHKGTIERDAWTSWKDIACI